MLSVVAVAALFAGACGNGDGDGGDTSDGLPRLPVGGAAAGGASAMSAEVAADEATADRRLIAPAAPIEYRLRDGVEAPATSAKAYRLVPTGDGVAAKVAGALDADEAKVQVSGISWFFSGYDADRSVSSSDAAEGCVRSPDGTTSCLEGAPPTTVPGVPSEGDARTRAEAILDDLGATTDGEFEIHGEDGIARSVLFTPEVGGMPIRGLQTQITFGREGRVEFASGILASVEEVGEYPLIGMDAALERLEQGYFGSGGGGVRPMTGVAESEAGSGSGGGSSGSTGSAGADAGTAEAPPEPGTTDPGTYPGCAPDGTCTSPPSPPSDDPTVTIEPQPAEPTAPLEPQVVDVTGADLVLVAVGGMCPEDPIYLVPAFELLPGPVGTIPAVEDDATVDASGDSDEPLEPCEGQSEPDVPAGKPEPAPLPPERGQEPAGP
jgi:hypothetical protein